MTRPPTGRKPARRLQRSRLSAAEVQEMFARLAGIDPSPNTELEYTTPFELLVAVVLSAQATDVGVNKATRRLYPVANTPQAILDLGEDGLKRHISTIGLFNAKARNVIALCRILVEQHGGEVPRTREAVEQPGGDHERDAQHQPAVRRVVHRVGHTLPPGQRQPRDAEETSSEQAQNR